MKLNEAQSKAVNLTGKNILVFASAGGGKTTVLIKRLMKRIIDDGVSLDEIIAMTFTSAASDNMKNRLNKTLKEEISKTDDLDRINYLNNQLAKLADAKISTIHAFCLSITKEYYYLLGISKHTTENIIEESLRSRILDELLDEVISEAIKEDKPALLNLAHNISSEIFAFDNLKKTILKVFNKASEKTEPIKWLNQQLRHKEITSLQDINPIALDIYLKDLKNYLIIAINNLNDILINVEIDNPSEINGRINDLKSLLEIDDYQTLLIELQTKLKTVKALKGNEEYKIYKGYYDDTLTDIASKLMSISMIIKSEKIATPLNNLLIKLTISLYEKFTNWKKLHEYIDFNDFEHYAYQILTMNDHAIAKKYQARYKEIMIDEFQDTNDIQYEMASLISNNNLFLVGDVKQSIYRFRNARPEIMQSLAKRDDFEKIHIKHNYRANHNLVTFNNALFDKLMNIDGNNFLESDAQIADLAHQLANNQKLIFNIVKPNISLSDEASRAHILAWQISELVRKDGLNFKDIAVLVRNHKEKIMIKKTFEDYNIPYFINDNEGYFKSYSIEVLLSYLKILINPKDNISLVSVLASKLYMYSDDELALMRPNFFDALSESNFMHDYHILKEYAKNHDFSGLMTYFMKINDFYNQYLDISERSNIDLLISKIEAYEIDTIDELCTFIEATMDKQKETALSISEEANVVKVMTIHTSKGLEFNTVILYSSLKNEFKDSKDAIAIDDECGIGFKVTSSKYRDSINTITRRAINAKNNIEDINESLRLLYVALTRAKKRMYFVDAGDVKDYRITMNLLLSRRGFTTYIYNVMKYDDAIFFRSFEKLPEIKAFDKLSIKEEQINIYTKTYQDKTSYTPSSLKLEEYHLELDKNYGTSYGTRMHNILEKLNFTSFKAEDIKTIDPFVTNSMMTRITNLVNHPIFKEATKGNYHNEYPFYFKDGDDMIHGIIDFVSFFDDHIVLIDYKTDVLDNHQDFITRYFEQLKAYEKVLSNSFKLPVQTYIYSFHLNEMISL